MSWKKGGHVRSSGMRRKVERKIVLQCKTLAS